jgi:ABC-2 type transport system permease protein
MNPIVRVFRYELRRQGRRKGYLFVTIGIPILALLLFYGLRVYQQSRQDSTPVISAESPIRQARPAGVVDYAGLVKPSAASGLIAFKNEAEAAAALQANKIGAYYVIAADYVQSGRVDMYYDRFNLTNLTNSTALSQALIQGLVARSGKQIDPAVIQRIQDRQPSFTTHTLNDGGAVRQSAGEGAAFALVYIFGLMLVFSAFTTSGYLMQSVVEEKESRMIEVLISSMRPGHLLAGKILSLGLLGLIQMVVWASVAVYIFRQVAPTVPGMTGLTITDAQFAVLLIYFVLGYLLFASIYASIGAIANSMREGPQLAAVVTIPAAIPLWATAILAAAPDGPLAVGLSIFPLTAPLAMVMRAAVTEVPITQLAASIGLLVLTIIFTMWLAGRLFRVNTLLAGQTPRLRDLPRLVRESI